jgi:hypothetical protein
MQAKGARGRSTEVGKAQALASPAKSARACVQGLRNALHNGSEAFLLLISAIITTRHQSLVCDDKLDLISRLLSSVATAYSTLPYTPLILRHLC